ncbi:tetratricopeptide repeat protein [Spirosoma gilvum]
MNRLFGIFLLWVFSIPAVIGQTTRIDSLKRLLAQTAQDTSRVLLLSQLVTDFVLYSTDSCMNRAQQALQLAQKIHFAKGESQALTAMSIAHRERGEFPKSLEYALKALSIARANQDQPKEAFVLHNIGVLYNALGEYRQAINYYSGPNTFTNHFPTSRELLICGPTW